MKKINKHLNYNSGIFNSKNERTFVKALNLCFNKIDELVDKVNELENKIEEINPTLN